MKTEGNSNRASERQADVDGLDSHLHAAIAGSPEPKSHEELELAEWKAMYVRVGQLYVAADEFVIMCEEHPEILESKPALYAKARITVREHKEIMERELMRRQARLAIISRLTAGIRRVFALFSRPHVESGLVKRLAAVEPSFQADIQSVQVEIPAPAAPAVAEVTPDVAVTSDPVVPAQADDKPVPVVEETQYVPPRQRRMLENHGRRNKKR